MRGLRNEDKSAVTGVEEKHHGSACVDKLWSGDINPTESIIMPPAPPHPTPTPLHVIHLPHTSVTKTHAACDGCLRAHVNFPPM